MFSKLFYICCKTGVWTTRDIDGTTVSDISDEGSGDDSLKDANVEVVGIVMFQTIDYYTTLQ